MTFSMPVIAGHAVTVTRGPFGRAYFDCSCGAQMTCSTKQAATRAGIVHHHYASGGCQCPPEVRAWPGHPSTGQSPLAAETPATH